MNNNGMNYFLLCVVTVFSPFLFLFRAVKANTNNVKWKLYIQFNLYIYVLSFLYILFSQNSKNFGKKTDKYVFYAIAFEFRSSWILITGQKKCEVHLFIYFYPTLDKTLSRALKLHLASSDICSKLPLSMASNFGSIMWCADAAWGWSSRSWSPVSHQGMMPGMPQAGPGSWKKSLCSSSPTERRGDKW